MGSTSYATYTFRYPEDEEVADVPKDIHELATDIATVFNAEPWNADVTTALNTRIIVQVGGSTPPGTFAEGTLLFIV